MVSGLDSVSMCSLPVVELNGYEEDDEQEDLSDIESRDCSDTSNFKKADGGISSAKASTTNVSHS